MKHFLLHCTLLRKLFLLFLAVCWMPSAFGQVVTSGTDFWFTLLQNFQQQGPIGLRVYISSTVGATGTVSVPGCAFSQNFVVAPNSVTFVQLPPCAEPLTSGIIENKAIHVISNNPVSVYCLNASDFTTDGTMVMPTNTLGFDYYVMSFKNQFQGRFSGESEFSVCAVMDNTQVEITPSANTVNGFPANVPQVINLNIGQMIQIKSDRDLTGSKVRVLGANCRFPVAVFGGNVCSTVGDCGACDHLYEMMSPNVSLGRQFVFVPTAPPLNGDVLRIMAVQNGTNVVVGGVPQLPLNAGQFITIDGNTLNTTATPIRSNNPIAVGSFAKGGECQDIRDNGDPMMIMLTPTDVLGVTAVNMATVAVAPPTQHFISLVTATVNTANITVTPAPISCEAWTPVPGAPAFSTRRCEINQGSFNVTSTGTGFNIYQYGWGERDSYGMAGAGIVNQNPINMGGSIVFQDSVCAGVAKTFSAVSNTPPLQLIWDWGDGSPIESGPAISYTNRTHTYPGCGHFKIKVEYSTNNGSFCAEKWVNVWAKPNAIIPNRPPAFVCQGLTAPFGIQTTGTCMGRLPWGNQQNIVPFHISYTINGVNQPPIVATRDQLINLNTQAVNNCLTYRFTSIVNQYQPWTGARCETILVDSFTVCPSNPTVTAVANPSTVCPGQSSTLTASGAVSYSWNNGQFNGNPFTVTPLVTTTYTVVGTDANNCTASARVTVTVGANPPPPTVTPNIGNYCLNQTPSNHTATSPSGGIFRWFTVPNGGVPIFTGATFSAPTNVLGNFNYYVENISNGCTSTRALLTVSVTTLPPPTVTPQVGNYCLNQTPSNHTASSQTGGTFRWFTVPNGGVPIFTGATFSVPTNVPGNFTYYVENIYQGCTSTRTPLNVTINRVPAPTVTPANGMYCINQTPSNHTATSPQGGSFLWYTVPNGGTSIFTGATYSVPTNVAGTFTYYVENLALGCTSQRTQVNITVVDAPVGGTISGTSSVCSGASMQLTLNNYTGGIVRWESSTDNFITITNIPNNTASLNIVNLTQSTCYRVVVANNACPQTFSNTFCITVDQPPVSGSINQADITVCTGVSVGNITLSGSSGNIVWESSTDCPGFTNSTTINNTTSTLTVGAITQTTCYRAQVSRGICPSVTSNVFTATLFQVTAGSVTTNQTLCIGTNPSSLMLTGQVGNIVRWESSTNNFVSVTTINNVTNTYNPVGLLTTTCFRAVVSQNGCSANSTPACIQVDALSLGGTVSSNQTVCAGTFVPSLSLQNRRGNVLRWESSTDNFTTINIIPNSNGLSIIQPGVITQTTCYRAIVQNGACPSAISTPACLTAVPVSNGGTLTGDQTICTGQTTTLNLTGETGTIIRWEVSTNINFPVNATTVINNTTNTYNTPVLLQTGYYRVRVQNAPCAGVYSNTVKLTVTTFPDRGVLALSQTVCSDVVPNTLTLTGYVGPILRWESSTDNFVSNTVTINNTTDTYNTGLLNQTISYRTVVNSPNCGIVYADAIKITVLPTTVPGTLPASQTVCRSSNGTLILSGYTGNILRWESSTNNFGSYSVINNTTATLNYINILQNISYRVLVQSPGCPARYSTITNLTVVRMPVGGTIYSSQTVCPNSPPRPLYLSGWVGTITRWESSTDNFATIQTINYTSYLYQPPTLTQTTKFRVVIETGCTPAYSSVATLTVPPMNSGNIAADMTFCTNPATGIFTLTNQIGNVIAWEGSTDNFITVQPFNVQSPTFNFQNVTTTTKYRARINSGGCTYYSPIATITVLREALAGQVYPDQTICSGQIPQQLVLMGASGNIIRWETSTDNFLTVQTLNNTLDYYRSPGLNITTQFRAVVQTPGCSEQYSVPAKVTVLGNLSGGTLATNQTICTGSNPTPLVLNGNGGSVVRWESSTDNFASFTSIGNTTNTLSVSNVSVTTSFRAVVSSKECEKSETYSNIVTITVVPAPEGGILTPNQTICTGNTPATLTLTSYVGNIIRWESSMDQFVMTVNSINNLTDTYTPSALTQTTYYRVVVGQNGCSDAVSNAVEIKVNPGPVGGTLKSSQTICNGNLPSPLFLTGYYGMVVRWESSTDNFATVTTIPYYSILYQPGGISQTTSYRVVLQTVGCSEVVSSVATVTVGSNNVIGGTVSADMTVCEGSTQTYTLTLTGYSGQILRWESSNNNFYTYRTIDNITNMLTFNSLTETTKFRVIIGTPGCALVASVPAEVTVTSIEQAGIILVLPDPIIGCEVNTGNLKLTNYVGTIVQWESSTDNFQNVTVIPNSNYINPYSITQATQFRVLVNNPSCGLMYSRVVTVAPSLQLTATPYRECNATGKVVVTASGGTPLYSYAINPVAGMQNQSGVFTGLPLGTYTITAKDKLGCTGTIDVTIPTTVTAPRINNIVTVSNTSSRVIWDVVQPGGLNVTYQLQYRAVGSPTWTGPINTNYANLYTITGLMPATAYEVQVRVFCVQSNTLSDWSPETRFNTIAKMGGDYSNGLLPEVEIYPNPSNGTFTIRLEDLGNEPASVIISDISGRVIYMTEQSVSEQLHRLTGIASGIYLLKIKSGDKTFSTKIVID